MEGLLTKVQLIKRNILSEANNRACAFCLIWWKMSCIFFKWCDSKAIWNNVLSWLGIEMEERNFSLANYLILIFSKLKRRFLDKILYLLWATTVWILCSNQNVIILQDGDLEILDFVDRIKALSQDWYNSFFCSNISHRWEDWKRDPAQTLTCKFL